MTDILLERRWAATSLRRRRTYNRKVLAVTLVLLNICDVLVTRYILAHHAVSHEGNGLLARFILSRWVWLPKVGIPLYIVFNSARGKVTRLNYGAIFVVSGVYWAVILWNLHVLVFA